MKPGMLLVLPLLLVAPSGPLASGTYLPGTHGWWPPPSRTPLQPCDNFCSSDADCPGSERCCSTGCGRECRLPPGARRGFCPRLDPGVVTKCLVECTSDSDCRGKEKCCSMGCHVFCVPPVPASPGVCPRRRVLQTFAPCPSSCGDDTDCPRGKKCCFTGCGLGCLPPDTGTATRGHCPCPAASDGAVVPAGICHLPPVPGPCKGRFHRYAYSPATGTCRPFIYSGCGGNANNFRMKKECQQACQEPGKTKE